MATTPSEIPKRWPKPWAERRADGVWILHMDAYRLNIWSECEGKFYLSQIENLRLKGRTAFKTEVGIWWSEVMQDYYEALAKNVLTEQLVWASAAKHWFDLKMSDYAALQPHDYYEFVGKDGDRQYTIGDKTFVLPIASMEMAAEYYRSYAEYDKRHWRVVGCEVGFGKSGECLVGSRGNALLNLTGRMDIVIIEDNVRMFPADSKSVDRIDRTFAGKWQPHFQTAGYVFAVRELAEQLGLSHLDIGRVCINGAARLRPSDKPRDGVKKPRFQRVWPYYNANAIEEWRNRALNKAERIAEQLEKYYVDHKQNPWVWADGFMCHVYSGCNFRAICGKPPNQRHIEIAANYRVAEDWEPYQTDDD